jgi:4-hydroxybenzoate polyprenyltransferase
MARIDKIKEEIGWLKVIFGILIVTDISLIAWLVENFGKVKMSLLIVGLIGAFLVTFTIVWIDNTAHRKIDELEEL